jgi:Holliday junction DNA helicase RuvB
MPLKPFTLIGATTRAGLLSAPLRDRFTMHEHLDYYSFQELSEIVLRNAAKLSLPIDRDASLEIARCSRGTPRIANNRLRWVRDFATSRAQGHATLGVCRDALAMQGIDDQGLDGQDRRYLETLMRVFHGGPAGVEALAHTMNTAVDTLTDDVEPFLLRSELVTRTLRGRRLTDRGYQHLGHKPPATPDEPVRSLFG